MVTTAALRQRLRRADRGTSCYALLLLLVAAYQLAGRRADVAICSQSMLGCSHSPAHRFSSRSLVSRLAASRGKTGTLYPKHAHSRGVTLPPESVYGPVEYKLKLNAEKGSPRFQELVTQLNWRMRECKAGDEGCEVDDDLDVGHYGEAIYRVGVSDDGQVVGLDPEELQKSMETLEAMAACMNAVVTVVSETSGLPPGNRTSVTALVRSSGLDRVTQKEVRICTCGNVDSGKSTLLGVLTRGLQDDGRGKARSPIFRHRHEMESGRTSTISHYLLGFDETGQVVNYNEDNEGAFRHELPEHVVGTGEAQARVVERAAKLISFVDLCGHEKYFKTTLMGLLGLDPDYLLCTVDANRGAMRGMVREHLIVAKALRIPTIVCLTKADLADEESIDSTLADVKGFLKEAGNPPYLIRNRQDVVLAAERLAQGYTPIFLCSAVTGENIPELKLMLNLLKKRTPALVQSNLPSAADGNVRVVLEDKYPQVPGVGTVVLGRVGRGTVRAGDILRLGPVDSNIAKAGFIEVRVASIQFEGTVTESLTEGTSGTIAIKGIGKKNKDILTDNPRILQRARVMLCKKSRLQPAMYLKANVSILQHHSSIRVGYEPVLHVGMVRQAAKIIAIKDLASGEEVQTLRAGDQAELLFRWKGRPEVAQVGETLVFRENLMKGMGTVTWVGEHEDPNAAKAMKLTSLKGKTITTNGGRGRGKGRFAKSKADKRAATRQRVRARAHGK